MRGQAGHQGCAPGACVLGGCIGAGGSTAVNHGHLGAFAQAVDAIGHHLVTVLQFTLHAHAVAVHHTHTNAPLGHGAVGPHQIHVVVLHRRAGHREHVLEQVDLQLHVDELVGKESAFFIGKGCLGFDGAGGGVDSVVHRTQPPAGEALLLLTVPQLYRQAGTTLKALVDGNQLCLGHRKHGIDGPHLGDGDDACGVRWAHHIAHIGLAQAQAPTDGCGDAGVAQLQLGGIDLGLVGGYRAFQLADQSFLGVYLLGCDRILGEQVLVALQIELGIFELGLVALQVALGLGQRGLVTAGINFSQQLPGLDLITFLELDGQQLPAGLGPHHGGGTRAHGADGADHDAHILALHHPHRHRLGGPCPAEPARRARGARRCGSGRLLLLPPPGPGCDSHQQHQ